MGFTSERLEQAVKVLRERGNVTKPDLLRRSSFMSLGGEFRTA
jgi:hypothetical protein